MKSGTRDEAEGKWHQVKGKIKEIAGKVGMNPDLEAEGKEETRTGQVQEKIGEIKKVVGKKKGAEHALYHRYHPLDSVAAGIVQRLHAGRRHSRPPGHRPRCCGGPGPSGPEASVRI